MKEMKSHPMTTTSQKSEAADELKIKLEEEFHGAMVDIDSGKNPNEYEDQRSLMSSGVYDLKISRSIKDVCLPMRCRLCAIPNNAMVDIFSSDVITKDIVEKIEYCLCIVVKESDPLPKRVCWLCLGKLEMCYDFNKAVAEAESQLLAYCQQTDAKIEETDSNCETPSPCDAQHDDTEYDRIEGTLGNCSNVEIDYNSIIDYLEELETTNITVRSSLALECLKPCSVVLVPTEIPTKNNIDNDGKGSPSEELLDADASTDVSNPDETLVSQNDPLSTCDLSQATVDSETQATEKFLGTDGRTEVEDIKHRAFNDPADNGQRRHNIANRKRRRGCHLNKQKYKCSTCGKKFCSRSNRDRHQIIHTGQRPFECSMCEKKFNRKSNRDDHHLTHTKEKPQKKSSRPQTAEKISNMDREKGFENMENPPIDAPDDIEHHPHKCNSCPRTFKSKLSLALHKRIHPNVGPYSCQYCGKEFVTISKLNEHHFTHTDELPYECFNCGRKFRSKNNRNHHHRIHTGERNFECSFCEQKFATKATRDRHHLFHTKRQIDFYSAPQNPEQNSGMDRESGFENMTNPYVDIEYHRYKCNCCARTFRYKHSLALHKKIHSGTTLYSCHYCGKEFVTKTTRNDHHQTHTSERPFECFNCEKKFRSKSCRDSHHLTHTGERPFECSICDKKFHTRSTRDRHRITHRGERPYECSICEKKFLAKGTRDRHQLSHTREEPKNLSPRPQTPEKISDMVRENGFDNIKNPPVDAPSLQVQFLCKDVQV